MRAILNICATTGCTELSLPTKNTSDRFSMVFLPAYVSLNNVVNWDRTFQVLSSERCFQFFSEMGLPQSIIHNPEQLALFSRNYIEARYKPSLTWSISAAAYLEEIKKFVENTFDRVAGSYDKETATFLYSWCLRYIVDDCITARLSAWRDLFRRFCGLVSYDGFSIPSITDKDVLCRICDFVHLHLYKGSMREVKQQIKNAKGFPLTRWEEWLEEKNDQHDNEPQNLRIVDALLDLVENIVSNHRVFKIWNALNNKISFDEREILIEWAIKQASVLGIPIHLVSNQLFY